MKIRWNTPAAEIESVKQRTFNISLSDADVKRLYEKAYGNGTTPEELIAGFIGDLVDGTYTRGSDERELAQRYFERCCYGLADKDFLQWALCECRFDDIADLLETIEDAERELLYYGDHPEEAEDDPDGVQAMRDEKEGAEKELAEIYRDYAESDHATRQSYGDGMAAIRRYLGEVRTMTERGRLDA